MNYLGLIAGIATFLIIGIFHIVVIKAEYYFSKNCWPWFLALGFICCVISLFTKITIISVLFAILGFTLFWSIKELFEQEKRVNKGWHPNNPKRIYRGAK
ncbi:MAG: DUF4491 family protein [Lachnospiraceae bacterium]